MIKGINLIPEETQRSWRLKKWRAALSVLAAAYLAVLAFVYTGQRAVIKEKRNEATALGQKKGMLIANSAQYAELQTKFKEIKETESSLKKRLELASMLADKRISWSAVLKRLSHDIPGGVWLKSLSTSDDKGAKKFRFLGSATTNRALADFMFTLENTGYFQDPTLSYSQKKDYDKTTVYDFEVSVNLKKTGEIMYEW